MTVLSGFDSAYGPTLEVAQEARASGATWWAGYLGGPGADHVWSASEWAVLRQAGLQPGCVWVPTYQMLEDPAVAVGVAVGRANALGLFGSIMLDTEEAMVTKAGPRLVPFVDAFCAAVTAAGRLPAVYAGAKYVPDGVAGFWPLWGTSQNPPAGQAIQYGPATRWGTSVDVDLADAAFPLASWVRPTPPPAPQPVVVHKEDQMLSKFINVEIAGGLGNVASPFPTAHVVSVVVAEQDPQVVHTYPAVPAFAGSTGDGLLLFGPGPYGTPPDGTYGFTVWAVEA